jgi:hypothetical protein
MHIQPATGEHLPAIQALYDEAIAFQRAAGLPYWRDLDLGVVAADIAAGHQFLLLGDGQVAGIFSFCPPTLLDEDIWRGRAPEPARYVHRIIVGRRWRGQRLFAPMLAWCEREVLRADLSRLRLDTWADNPVLMAYYASFGFAFVGESSTSDSERLPPQYRGLRLAIMEKKVLAGP